jgi:hypothetical protein
MANERVADRAEFPTSTSAESLVAFLRLLARCIEEEADSLEADPESHADLLHALRDELFRWGVRSALLEMGSVDHGN